MIVIFLSGITAILASNCTFTTQSGTKYDLSDLHKQDQYYTVRDNTYESAFFAVAYTFNFCSGYPTQCQNTPGIYESIEVLGQTTDSCEIIGKPTNSSIIELDSGISLTFTNDNNRKATFNVFCSQQQSGEFKFENKNEEEVNFSIESPIGCKSQLNLMQSEQSINYGKEIGIVVLISLVLFLGVSGVLLMQNKKEQQKKESEEGNKNEEQLIKENEDIDGQKIEINQ